MVVSGNVLVDSTGIGCSDHSVVWIELGRVTKRGKKVKRVLDGVCRDLMMSK